jgi:hypothetical protein
MPRCGRGKSRAVAEAHWQELQTILADAEPEERRPRHACSRCERWENKGNLIRAIHEKGSPFYCHDCWYELARYFSDHEKRANELDGYYRRRYGITFIEYGDRYLKQRGVCAICQERPSKPLVVDHCHDSGQVRGLLCSHCNAALGFMRDRPEVLARAIAYLVESFQATR